MDTLKNECFVYQRQSDDDYKKLGLSKETVELWEDGLRTDFETNEFEWWYFDCELEDTSKIVITFFTKSYVIPTKGLAPFIRFNYSKPDGTEVARTLNFKAGDFSADKNSCDVKIGNNIFKGDLKNYNIHIEFEDYSFDIKLKNNFTAWRPHTGHYNFGTDYLAWVVPVPQGEVLAEIRENGQVKNLKGHGYHDHNWGKVPMRDLIHHWYWGRAQVGPYLIIASCLYGEKQYEYQFTNTFFIGRDGKILADNGENSTLKISDVVVEPETNKPVPNKLVFEYKDEQQNYRLTLERKRDILHQPFHDEKGGAYLRFAGNALLEVKNQNETSSYNETAIWEEMYFGLSINTDK